MKGKGSRRVDPQRCRSVWSGHRRREPRKKDRVKHSWKGAYLSGLVYPGLGQIVQKHYVRGIALAGIVTVSLAATVYAAVQEAQALLTALADDSGSADLTTLLREAGGSAAGGDNGIIGISSLLIAGCWVVGIVDAYLAGKKIDRGDSA
jgi:hypothetical protein